VVQGVSNHLEVEVGSLQGDILPEKSSVGRWNSTSPHGDPVFVSAMMVIAWSQSYYYSKNRCFVVYYGLGCCLLFGYRPLYQIKEAQTKDAK
jgi:hypothetical protein